MPKHLKENAIFLENTFYSTYHELTKNRNIEQFVRDRYDLLKKSASIVVTSRMHIASPCIGMGIPVILVRNSIDYRFSWIDKYIPIYTEKNANNIDWNPCDINVETIKNTIIQVASQRILSTFNKYKEMLALTEYYQKREKVEYDLPEFSKSVIDFVTSKWSQQDKWLYAIWGENDASERLYQYLSNNYPGAKFVAFYDSYKKIKYHGRQAEHPSKIIPTDDVFIFVTGYTATDAAKELFQSIGKSESMYYLFGSVVRGY